MRHSATTADEPHMIVRSLSVNYARGAAEPRHRHPWPQLLYAEHGTLRAEIDTALWLVPPRRAIWIPRDCPHRLTMLGEVHLRTLYLMPDSNVVPSASCVTEVSGLLHELILRICTLGWLDARSPEDLLLANLLGIESGRSQTHPHLLTLPSDPRALKLAHALLNADPDAPPLEVAMAAEGLSRRTAERIFSAETGLSPARWYRLARLSRAVECLANGGSVEAAAELAGYASRSAFSEVFNAAFGVSPAAFRRGSGAVVSGL